mmetsp:Transcript_53890/g.138828  ORF Transcript_53890/g.138828 Transcript_53890/m.138828 type:complete len:155 (+) Transcript_53890:1-465(+)
MTLETPRSRGMSSERSRGRRTGSPRTPSPHRLCAKKPRVRQHDMRYYDGGRDHHADIWEGAAAHDTGRCYDQAPLRVPLTPSCARYPRTPGAPRGAQLEQWEVEMFNQRQRDARCDAASGASARTPWGEPWSHDIAALGKWHEPAPWVGELHNL